MILFCLPYAGGSATAYYTWKKYLNKGIELQAVELKGRGVRIGEEFYANMEEAVNDIFDNIKNLISTEEYAIYGHSMGALLAYELYYKIKKENLNAPKHIFFSGQAAPGSVRSKNIISGISDDLFIDTLKKLGGTPKEVFENQELLDIVLPIIRSDFIMIGEYDYKKQSEKLSCDITIFNGIDDDMYSQNQIEDWKNTTYGDCKIYNFEGDHFFINQKTEEILNIINNTLSEK